jgi:phosphoribosylamine--glycine ligase
MRVLVIGGGAREHTLAWKLARDSGADVVAAPGNPGIEAVARCVPVDMKSPAAMAALADEVDADLTVIGPEDPLAIGAVDALHARGRLAFGPTADAAALEGSKRWMKELLASAGVPTARHASFGEGQEADAIAFLDSLPGLYVIKTDGLAAGKGVVVTESISDAREAVREYLSGRAFGDAGRTVVIEEGMRGPELSLLVLCDGDRAVALTPAQDHKRVGDGDTGPNTGGMGAYSPVPIAGPDLVDEVMAKAVEPTLAALSGRGIRYRGILYAGLMLTAEGPKIVEYNVRFGDPECEVVIPRLSSDLAVHLHEAATGSLRTPVTWKPDACVCVVLASEGYPHAPRTGDIIEGIDEAARGDDTSIFHAGTKREGGRIVTAGGRVLAVTALGADIAAARARAYAAAGQISWPGMHFRRDIAQQGPG